jgi:hypothetical protein
MHTTSLHPEHRFASPFSIWAARPRRRWLGQQDSNCPAGSNHSLPRPAESTIIAARSWAAADKSLYMCVEALPADLSQPKVCPQVTVGVHQGSLVKSQLLYQLSYAGAPVILFAETSATCRRIHRHPPTSTGVVVKLLSIRSLPNECGPRCHG